jgi:sulfite reductase alpha subunit-like flavoprotein
MSISTVIVAHGGELAKDVAEQLTKRLSDKCKHVSVRVQCASERPRNLVDHDNSTLICFVMQTIENAAPTEEGGSVLRYFKRKTHPCDLLADNKFQFAVLGLGDSNLLLDRQTTAAKDCNQAAQELDTRLDQLGGKRFHALVMADERTEMMEVEPWIDGICSSLSS